MDCRGCPGPNRVGVVAVGKVMVLGMAISLEMDICFFLLDILSTSVIPCIVDIGCLDDVRSKQVLSTEETILERAMKAAANQGKQSIRGNARHGKTATGDIKEMIIMYCSQHNCKLFTTSTASDKDNECTIACECRKISNNWILTLEEYCESGHRRFRQYC